MNEQMKKILSEERESISPKGDIKNKLNQAFEAKHKRSITPLWINYPVPVWQMAACIIVLIVAGIATGKFKPEEKTFSELAIADTVYVEKIIPGKSDTVFIEKKSVVSKKVKTHMEAAPATQEAPASVGRPEMMQPDMHISDFH